MYFYQQHNIYQNSRYVSAFYVSDSKDEKLSALIIQKKPPIHVKLKSTEIEFYFSIDNEEGVFPNEVIPILSIPLNHLSNLESVFLKLDLLINEGFVIKTNPSLKGFESEQYLNTLRAQLTEIPNDKIFGNSKEADTTNMFEVVLAFLFDILDEESDFYLYDPELSEHIRTKLEESPFINLLIKKYQFYQQLNFFCRDYDLSNAYYHNEKRKATLDLKYNEYLQLLVSDILGKREYNNSIKANNWFLDPEAEVSILGKWARKISFRNEDESKKVIQNYLLSKHNLSSATNYFNEETEPYKVLEFNPIKAKYVNLQFSISIIFFTCLLLWFFTNPSCLSGVLLFLGFLFFALLPLIFLGTGDFNIISPRLFVAILTSWLIIIGASEFIDTQINLDNKTIIWTSVILLVVLIGTLYSKINHHSNFQIAQSVFKSSIWKKMLVILLVSFNITFVFGVVFHSFFIKSVLINNRTVSEKVFNAELDSLKNVIRLNGVKVNAIRDIAYYSTDLLNVVVSVKQSVLQADSCKITKKGHIRDLLTAYNARISTAESIIQNSKFQIFDKDTRDTYLKFDELIRKSRLTESMCLDSIISNLVNSVVTLQAADSFYNQKMNAVQSSLQTFDENSIHKSLIFDHLQQDSILLKTGANVYLAKPIYKPLAVRYNTFLGELFIYHRMLLLQILVVMTLAIIGQLLVSGNAITDGL